MAHIDIGQDSVLNLYSDVEITDGLQVAFSSAAQQYNYFNGRLVKQYTGMSYVYRNGVVKIQDTPQVVAKANYISFNNPSFESKPIYARIVDYQYVNNATVKIAYAVDWFQTFMFDVDYRSCQIMREHLSETDWQKAVANPWDRSIQELNSTESFNFSDEDFKVITTRTADGTYGPDFTTVPNSTSEVFSSVDYFVLNLANGDYTNTEEGGYPHLQKWFDKFTEASLPISSDFFMTSVNSVLYSSEYINGNYRASNVYIMDAASSNTMDNDWAEDKSDPATIHTLAYGIKALTEAGLTGEIVSIYVMPEYMLYAAVGRPGQGNVSTLSISDRVSGGANPKLKRSPFSYMQMVAPNGNTKEFKYELFNDPKNGIAFAVDGNITGIPMLACFPVNYKYGGVNSGNVDPITMNYSERLETLDFMQVPYTIDAFLAYMSGIYQQAIQTMSTPTQQRFLQGGGVATTQNVGNSAISSLGNAAELYGAAKGGSARAGAKAVGGASFAAGATAAEAALSAGSSIFNNMGDETNARDVLRYMYGNKPSYDFSGEKARYIENYYRPGSAGGFWALRLNRGWFECFFKTLNDAMTETVDNYFNAFGYNSGRIGVPRVCNFIKGTGDQPHFVSMDDGPCTYIQTGDMHVVSNLKPASDYIEALFNAGCRFINGNGR